ncbi:retrovirus-related pol polyprotein from transposon TNT 1-94 [Tanacetum coccineum]
MGYSHGINNAINVTLFYVIIAGAENRPPMLEKSLYDSWKSRMELYIENWENGRMILNSLQNGPLVWPTVVEEDGTTRTKKYEELSVVEKLQADCDNKATNIVLQGLPPDVSPFKMAGLLCNKFKGDKDKVTLVLAIRVMLLVLGEIMHEGRQGWLNVIIVKQLAFLADPSIPDSQTAQTTIPNTIAFQTEDLDAYDYDCKDVSNAKAVLMANLSNYGSDVISEVPHFEPYHTDMDNQSVHAMQSFEQIPVVDFINNEITSDSNIILYSQYLQETQQAVIQDTNLYAQQDSMILSVIEQMSEQLINHRLNIDLSTRKKMIDSQMDDMIKEKLALNESKEKESKYIDKEIDLEKKIKELDNIVYKVGQSAQTMHITKPQVFYDDTHKQALGYQNLFYLKKTLQIKPTLYDGSVITSQHAASPVVDDEETLILEEVSRSKMLAKQNDPMSKEKKVNTTPINYIELNRLSEDFENDRLLQQIMYQDVLLSVMNSTTLNGESVNLLNNAINQEVFQKDSFSDNQNALEIREYFENNDLKDQLQAKDTTICKLKEHIKSMQENDKEEKVKHEMDEIETINIELEHSETQKPEIKVYSRRPKQVKSVGSSKKAKIVESKIANNSEPNHSWGSNDTNVSSSSSLVNGRLSRLFFGTIRFENDQIAKIMGYGDYQLGNVIFSRVYYVEGLGHNLFSFGQFCDVDLDVAFRTNTCFIQNLEGVDLLLGSIDTNLYTISLDDMLKTSLICKRKKSSHQPKAKDTNQEKFYLLHIDLCGPMILDSINKKKYILVIVDDYSQFTWVKFLRSKDEAPDAIIKCIKNIQVYLNATVRNVRTDNGTEFVNQTLREFYENVGITHQTHFSRTPQ